MRLLLAALLTLLIRGERTEAWSPAAGAAGARRASGMRVLLGQPQPKAGGVAPLAEPVEAVLRDYMDFRELEAHLEDFQARCGAISKLHSIGQSVEGRNLSVLELGTEPGKLLARPHVRMVGNMHGDEPSGRQLLLAFAEWLCAERGSGGDPRAARLLRSARLWLLPSMNPDGFERHSRANAHGTDLNRDFPDPFRTPLGAGLATATGREEPETLAVMRWVNNTHFTAGLNLHEGAVVANYPLDGTPEGSSRYSAAPDDPTFVHLAKVYAGAHATMHNSTEFPGGITNGAAWYPLTGGMQDWVYYVGGCLELTLELWETKWPAPRHLRGMFLDNLPALLAFVEAATFGGLRGTVRDGLSVLGGEKPLAGATVSVRGEAGPGINITAGRTFGDFARPLAPGPYTVTVRAEGYSSSSHKVTIPAGGAGAALHAMLTPLGHDRGGAAAAQAPPLSRASARSGVPGGHWRAAGAWGSHVSRKLGGARGAAAALPAVQEAFVNIDLRYAISVAALLLGLTLLLVLVRQRRGGRGPTPPPGGGPPGTPRGAPQLTPRGAAATPVPGTPLISPRGAGAPATPQGALLSPRGGQLSSSGPLR